MDCFHKRCHPKQGVRGGWLCCAPRTTMRRGQDARGRALPPALARMEVTKGLGFDATPATYRGRCYPPFHARQKEKENYKGGREMRVSTPPARKLGGFEAALRLRQTGRAPPREGARPVWRRGWDSNPRGLAPKLISSQPRYDRFDTSPNRPHFCANASIITQVFPLCKTFFQKPKKSERTAPPTARRLVLRVF